MRKSGKGPHSDFYSKRNYKQNFFKFNFIYFFIEQVLISYPFFLHISVYVPIPISQFIRIFKDVLNVWVGFLYLLAHICVPGGLSLFLQQTHKAKSGYSRIHKITF